MNWLSLGAAVVEALVLEPASLVAAVSPLAGYLQALSFSSAADRHQDEHTLIMNVVATNRQVNERKRLCPVRVGAGL